MKNSQDFQEFIKDARLRTKNGQEYLVGLCNGELQAIELYNPDTPTKTIHSYLANEIFNETEVSDILDEIMKCRGE